MWTFVKLSSDHSHAKESQAPRPSFQDQPAGLNLPSELAEKTTVNTLMLQSAASTGLQIWIYGHAAKQKQHKKMELQQSMPPAACQQAQKDDPHAQHAFHGRKQTPKPGGLPVTCPVAVIGSAHLDITVMPA